MQKIGIITFHAAHNYGSVLQAYATQKLIEQLGYSNEIINYRLENQIQYYNHFYSTRFGLRNFILRLISLPEKKKRSERREKFEKFINLDIGHTSEVYHNYEELKNANLNYKVLISGSDQVWNIHCKAEFATEPPESILGYFLALGDDDAFRISYSSSIGTMTKEELIRYQPYLERYQYLSVREGNGAEIISELTGKEVINTLDPTLMLNEHQWDEIMEPIEVSDDYIFLYTLKEQHHAIDLMKSVSGFAASKGLKVVCVSPFSSIHVKGIEYHQECGPKEFLSYIKNASLVVTDSYHGTIFSINFGTPFYTVLLNKDIRKEQILTKMRLDNRKIYSLDEFDNVDNFSCDYSETNIILESERKKTLNFISDALSKTYVDS